MNSLSLAARKSGSTVGGVSRRRFSAMLASVVGLPLLDWQDLNGILIPDRPDPFLLPSPTRSYPLYDEAVSRVLSEGGFQSRIALEDSILKLVEHGVIDKGKVFALDWQLGAPPRELDHVLSERSEQPILLTALNATSYVNLLWPIGLATHMAANAESPVNGDSLYQFASTGGWTLGTCASGCCGTGADGTCAVAARESNGGVFFNKYAIVDLTSEQEARVVRIAKSTYRPCCNNSTFFQDCNHGSALLGVLQLGASQGLSDQQLYREALAFNSFWFPDYYLRTALFFKVLKKTDWADVDPRIILGFDYSAGGPWQQNVAASVGAIPGLFPPPTGGGAGCGV